MKRFINGLIVMILAFAITAGGAFLYDLWHSSWKVDEMNTTEVTSDITSRIYALDPGEDTKTVFSVLDDTADEWVKKKIASSGGGKYTDTSGETHYVPSSGGGSYSGGGGYYYDDDWSGGSSSGGGGSSNNGPGTVVDIYIDDTPYNYCQNCGREYIGNGGCPYPDCEAYNP